MTPDPDEPRPEPPAPNAHARTRASGAFTVVEVTGEIDLATADLVAEHLSAAALGPAPDILVDLRRVTFLDCSCLRVLCRAETRAREQGGRLRLVADAPRVRRLLLGAGLMRRFPPLPGIPGERRG
ncbi:MULTISPECIES: STAS domain-containing protein [Streptomyces]|uniref:Anti-sigma factor antagonist n=1 Tax=Streptomyces doudnae TaxID=3075536 RepID=A0ABD5EGH6_9ACTN|nr:MULTISPECIES: STAS domain-containing protein [unclassified Streptomyces]MDT0433772.1 STAS domain-containing protein [Streptomyces sp. DSM 41981]MYQ68932.1 anti-sigma factor antagonist [Streptomyces sp. SID4950]SCE50147.1 anti-anti-sigma factor [Streptomyces sp. SolWspMP-5a-2]